MTESEKQFLSALQTLAEQQQAMSMQQLAMQTTLSEILAELRKPPANENMVATLEKLLAPLDKKLLDVRLMLHR